MILGPTRVFKNTAIAKLHRLLTTALPRALCGDHAALRRCWAYFFEQRNRAFQLVAASLFLPGLAVFALDVAPEIPNRYMGAWHWVLICPVIAATVILYTLACVTDPGYVTHENARGADELFEYDNVLFTRRECSTCKVARPARAKHCRACGRCVQMMDHHCIWINNCVGLRNARWFLGFLVAFTALCAYGALVVATVVLELRARVYGSARRVSWGEVLYVVHGNGPLAGLLVLLGLLAPIIGLFAVFQIRIVMLGYTANEEEKWVNVRDAIDDGVLFAVVQEDGSEALEVVEPEEQERESRSVRRIEGLDEIVNVYDRGPWSNLLFVLFPPA